MFTYYASIMLDTFYAYNAKIMSASGKAKSRPGQARACAILSAYSRK